ncbi:MAG: DNA helicase RecQ [Pseudomonadota bacterium]
MLAMKDENNEQSTPDQQQIAHLSEKLQEVFGYSEFRQGQQDVMLKTLHGQDTLVLMPTGGGKSLCYQLPALCAPGLTVVISPLLSLMQDQVEALQAMGVAAATLHSGLSSEQSMGVLQQLQQQQIKVLYVSPERALQPNFIERLQSFELAFIAIDEAHCISQWGHDFRPTYGQLGQLRQYLPNVSFMALTATADAATQHDIIERLQLQNPYCHRSSFDRPNIRYVVQEKYKPLKQIKDYVKKQKGSAGIVYCGSRKKTEEISESLQQAGIKAMPYHAGLDHSLKETTLRQFLRDDVDVVVATIAFGMGINKPNIRFVIHFDIPRSIESYYQETGRAGRDGLPAEALMLFDPRDAQWIQRMIDEQDNEHRRLVEKQKFAAMQAMAEAQTCRRLVLLNYFNEFSDKECGNCDLCLDPPQRFDALQDAQKALSCVYRVGQQFGIAHVVEVLRGSKNQRVLDLQHDQLSTYGLGQNESQEYWFSVLRQLIHRGFIVQDIRRFAALQLTEEARAVLRGEVTLELAKPRVNLTATRNSITDRGDYNKILFRRLRKLRKDIADRDGVPPFVVFSDASLVEMCVDYPTSADEMLSVSGVGRVKLERYGHEFIRAIEQFLNGASERQLFNG